MVFVIHWHESAMDIHVCPIPIPPPTSLSTRSLWVFPVHQVRALVSCIHPGLVIWFTLDNIHVSMLFSWNIPPSPSPTESKFLKLWLGIDFYPVLLLQSLNLMFYFFSVTLVNMQTSLSWIPEMIPTWWWYYTFKTLMSLVCFFFLRIIAPVFMTFFSCTGHVWLLEYFCFLEVFVWDWIVFSLKVQ